MPEPQGQPTWFTPLRLLLIFCLTNLMVYLDRGLIASNGVNGSPPSEESPKGTGIQGDFQLSYFQDGLLPAAFMVGLLLSSPVFAEVCKQYSAFRLLGIGMAVWALACAGCAVAPNFVVLLICRAFVGVGEASFVALAAPFIDDYAPAASKTQWFAAFYLCIPVGFASGYIVGGLVAGAMNWRWAFVFEALAMVPFVLFALSAQPLHLHGTKDQPGKSHLEVGDSEGGPGAPTAKGTWSRYLRGFLADVRQVTGQKVWITVCGAYTLYVAVLGVYAYWGPKAGKALYFPGESGGDQADLVFGGVTVLTGVLGSVSGGLMLDKMGSSLRNANLVCAISNLVGCVVLLISFTTAKSFAGFMASFALGQLAIFLLQAPVAAIGMWCVPTALRPLAASLTTLSIHLLGDVPSPPLLGQLQSILSEGKSPAEAAQQWRVSMSILTLLLVPSGLLFLLAAYFSTPEADFRLRRSRSSSGVADALVAGEEDDAPLLAAEDGETYSSSSSPVPTHR